MTNGEFIFRYLSQLLQGHHVHRGRYTFLAAALSALGKLLKLLVRLEDDFLELLYLRYHYLTSSKADKNFDSIV